MNAPQEGTPTVVLPEQINDAYLAALFAAVEGLSVEVINGMLGVKRGRSYRIQTLANENGNTISFRVALLVRAGVTPEQLLRFVNRVNSEVLVIRAWWEEEEGVVYFEYYLLCRGGTTEQTILFTHTKVDDALWYALEEDTDGVIQ